MHTTLADSEIRGVPNSESNPSRRVQKLFPPEEKPSSFAKKKWFTQILFYTPTTPCPTCFCKNLRSLDPVEHEASKPKNEYGVPFKSEVFFISANYFISSSKGALILLRMDWNCKTEVLKRMEKQLEFRESE